MTPAPNILYPVPKLPTLAPPIINGQGIVYFDI
jgi:hypothetical protein